ncbi:Protein CBG26237 [Caenorhabditis briggsae]|uniref:Protein CBG26237 n=1 Tax=Caenorhabditis briggsae TaxID=6238 RepID=B6IIZ2_CAEBR|nr:Protein CBG26237 [Caenorhabditis briggsae]CAR99872.1 Protein CBG26237 [Caenorhabditis briggsae]
MFQGILSNTWDPVNNHLVDAIIFKNNHKSLLEDSKSCYALRSALYVPENEIPKFDGKNCGLLGLRLP